jgi:hypothetical protein
MAEWGRKDSVRVEESGGDERDLQPGKTRL